MTSSHPRRRALVLAVALAAAALAVATGAWMGRAAWIGAGFYAKQLCSGVFVGGRDAAEVAEEDLAVTWPAAIFRRIAWRVDGAGARTEATWLGLVAREARHRPGYGCTLVVTGDLEPVPEPAPTHVPRGESATADAESAPLARVLDEAFGASGSGARSRAVVVMRDGRIIAERYAPGFDARTRFSGWSLTKSVFNAVVGALVLEGALDLAEPARIAAWRAPGDPRGAVTYDHLLRMSTGMAFSERYGDPFSDVARMLFGERAAGRFAASRPLADAPGTAWRYASGTTNALAEALRGHVPSGLRYHDLPRRLVFERLGMASAVAELDESGAFVASSYMLATARDWATFGALFAADGVWSGRRVLPEGWVEYSRRPAPAGSAGKYGAHFWLYDAADRERAQRAAARSLPEDAFYAAGYAGQRIIVVPSLRLAIARLGQDAGDRAFDHAVFAARVIAALEDGAR
jgi:CubicO group peptidase (beta-lactamase class C family)